MELHIYKAKLIRVVDGDTIDFNIDLGFRIWTQQRVRLLDVDSPERKFPGFNESTEFTKQWFDIYNQSEIILRTEKKDSFGRWLGWVHSGDECLNSHLLLFLVENNFIPFLSET